MPTPREARSRLLELIDEEQGEEVDVRALCFSVLLIEEVDKDKAAYVLNIAATAGFAFAQAELASFHGLEMPVLAETAANQGERDGFHELGIIQRYEWQRDAAKKSFLCAAQFGRVDSMTQYSCFLQASNPQKWRWLGEAAKKGNAIPFLSEFFDFNDVVVGNQCIFMVGSYLVGHIDESTRTMFGYDEEEIYSPDSDSFFDEHVAKAKSTAQFFTDQSAAARRALDTWCLMAIRINSKVNRDIRKKIGMLIWEDRWNGDYQMPFVIE